EPRALPMPEIKREPPELPSGQDGIFSDIDSAVRAAVTAQRQLDAMTLAKRYDIVDSMRRSMRENAEMLAWLAHQETGLGHYEDKIKKNLLVADKTPGPEILRPLSYTGDRGLTLMERAPYGVIAAITPITNPTSTIVNNAIGIISAGNSVIFNAHPGAKDCSARTIRILNQAIVAAGGPPNLITAISDPTIESAQALMRHRDIRLLLVTGGAGVVREAMGSGKKSICAGPGNPPVVVDETAVIEQAARDIVIGASFDNNIVCVLEKEILAVDSIADRLKTAMGQFGAYEITSSEMDRLEKVIFKEKGAPRQHGAMNKDFVGKSASFILQQIGINVGEEIKIVLVEVPQDHPLIWTEQLMPVIPITRVRSADEGIDLAKEVEHGFGHTAVMHSRNIDNLSRMAREINTSLFIKNGPSLAGLGFGGEGFTSLSIASPTGEGLTTALTFSRERRCTLVDHFRIV
ncbi:MAG: aldehyde dehydrogenase family protein, partial [Anaerolineae bacterium]